MQVFVAFAVDDFDRVRRGVARYYNNHHYNAGRGAWFIATEGETARQVATKLGLGDVDPADGNTTGGIVVPVTSFWGRHSVDLWEWIGTKQRQSWDG